MYAVVGWMNVKMLLELTLTLLAVTHGICDPVEQLEVSLHNAGAGTDPVEVYLNGTVNFACNNDNFEVYLVDETAYNTW